MPVTDVRIRRATEADLSAVLGCLAAAFQRYRADYTPGAYADTVPPEPAARERFRSMHLFVAEDRAGSVVGTIASATISAGEGHLRGMAVRPEFQGKGVAAALLLRAVEDLRSAGCRRITLDTTLPLARAVRFYEKSGFRRSGKVTDFFGMPLIEYVRELT